MKHDRAKAIQSEAAPATGLDPVCGMEVDPTSPARFRGPNLGKVSKP
jgi:hypothetical protein